MKKVIFLIWSSLLLLSCSKFSKIQKSDDLLYKYEQAMNYYEKKDYYHSGILFEEVIPLLRGRKESEEANFYYAYSQYYQNNKVMASYYFKRFLDTYPRSAKVQEAHFMSAKSLYEDSPHYSLDQTSTHDAIDAIQLFLDKYESSPYIAECNKMYDELHDKLEIKAFDNAKIYYKIQDYKAAIVALSNFRRDYPDSKLNDEVAYLRIVSQYSLAKRSIESKRKERYLKTIEFYQEFVDKYSTSKRIQDAEKMFSNSQLQLEALAKK